MNTFNKSIVLTLAFVCLFSAVSAQLRSGDMISGSGRTLERKQNLTMPFQEALTFDIRKTDCENREDLQYVNKTLTIYKDLMLDQSQQAALKVDLKLVSNLMTVAFQNIVDLDDTAEEETSLIQQNSVESSNFLEVNRRTQQSIDDDKYNLKQDIIDQITNLKQASSIPLLSTTLDSFIQIAIRDNDVEQICLEINSVALDIVDCIEQVEDLDENYEIYEATMGTQISDLNYWCEDVPVSALIINNRAPLQPRNPNNVDEATVEGEKEIFFGNYTASSWDFEEELDVPNPQGSERFIRINETGVNFYEDGGEAYLWEDCAFNADGRSFFTYTKISQEMITFTIDEEELEVEFNFKVPATVVYEREPDMAGDDDEIENQNETEQR